MKQKKKQSSKTAVFTALHRSIYHMENPASGGCDIGNDSLASLFLPGLFRFLIRFNGMRRKIRKKFDRLIPGLHEYIVARTRFFDEAFVQSRDKGITQIVILGAGFDTRALRLLRNGSARVIELDIAATQEAKRNRLKKHQVDSPDNIVYAPIDFNQDNLRDVLQKAGYREELPTLFLWEGVSYYLDPESVDQMLGWFSKNCHPDSQILFDYTVPVTEANINDYGISRFRDLMRKNHAREQMLFACSDAEMTGLLEKHRLRLIEHHDNLQIADRYLNDKLHEAYDAGPITAHFRFARVIPKS